METICTASGWWVLYRNKTRQRVAAFVNNENGCFALVSDGRAAFEIQGHNVENVIHQDDIEAATLQTYRRI